MIKSCLCIITIHVKFFIFFAQFPCAVCNFLSTLLSFLSFMIPLDFNSVYLCIFSIVLLLLKVEIYTRIQLLLLLLVSYCYCC